jgi:NAD-dependent deacetylase
MGRVAPFTEFAPLDVHRFSRSARVFVLTGAGISAESGIRTFRDAGGLWENFRFEEVASPQGWADRPAQVWRFYAHRRAQAAGCEPNPAHTALARLERRMGDRFFLCTQNVDDLHERAGSVRLVHMHGELFKSRCETGGTCGRPPYPDRAPHTDIPRCPCGARVRPHIVWFGEVPFGMERIERELQACDVFVSIGSSGSVYPAASFAAVVRARTRSRTVVRTRTLSRTVVRTRTLSRTVVRARTLSRTVAHSGCRTIYVGAETPDNLDAFDECRLGPASRAVPALFERVARHS